MGHRGAGGLPVYLSYSAQEEGCGSERQTRGAGPPGQQSTGGPAWFCDFGQVVLSKWDSSEVSANFNMM